MPVLKENGRRMLAVPPGLIVTQVDCSSFQEEHSADYAYSPLPLLQAACEDPLGCLQTVIAGQHQHVVDAFLQGAAAENQGPRKHMEDTHLVQNSLHGCTYSDKATARGGIYAVRLSHWPDRYLVPSCVC